MAQDSGGAGRYRGGSGTVWEVEPLGHEMTVIAFGEGRQIPTMGAADAENGLHEPKLGRLEIVRDADNTTVYTQNTLTHIQPGQRARNTNPGGGGYGIAFERPVNAVLHDYVQGLITLEGARLDYGVVITDGEVDIAATDAVRATQNITA